MDSLDGLFHYLNDKSTVVQNVTAKTLYIISSNYAEFYLAHTNFKKYLDIVLKNIASPDLEISSHMCKIIHMFFSCQNPKLQEPLLLDIDRIFATLMQNAYR